MIGTLARLAAAQHYPVYVVSSDKDMLQLVNERVCVLNPPKDNLICDRAKVEELLGVPPERVVDVMALRGDAIDNIPGAPGIGDKGSVEIIRRFGSAEQALEHAAEVEKKIYRESLLQNREVVLFSKELATIDYHVPGVALDVEPMAARAPDAEAARDLFTELEFTTLAKDFAPTVELGATDYADATTAAEVDAEVRAASEASPLAFALADADTTAPTDEASEEELEGEAGTLPLAPPAALATAPSVPSTKLGISAHPGRARVVALASEAAERLRSALADPAVPKACARPQGGAARAGAARYRTGRGGRRRLCSTATCSTRLTRSHALTAVALRRFNLKLSGEPAERADVTGRLAAALRREVEEAGLAPRLR